jgi:multiple sugar transport system substrate-binding protein
MCCMKRKVAALLLSGIMMVSFLSGCNGKTEGESSGTSSLPKEEITIKNDGGEHSLVLVEVDQGEEKTAALEEIIAKYEADFPDTDIELVTVQDEAEVEELLQQGKADLFQVSHQSLSGLVEQNLVYDLDEWLEAWDEFATLTPGAKFCVRSMGSDYAYTIPFTMYQKALYYRADWFNEYAAEHPEEELLLIPRNWEEVQIASEKLASYGEGLAVAGKTELPALMDSVIWSAIGGSALSDLSAGYFTEAEEHPTIFSIEAVQEALEQFKTVFSASLAKDALTWEEEDAVEAFKSGETAMLIAGRDVYQELQSALGEEAFGITNYPKGAMGIALSDLDFDGWSLAENSAEKETAAHFLFYLSNSDNNTHFAKEVGMVPIHLEAVWLEPSLLEGELGTFCYMNKKTDEFAYASAPIRYDGYETFQEQGTEKIAQTLAGDMTSQELAEWLESFWTDVRETEGDLWK